MATSVQVKRSGTYEDIDYQDFRIDIGISERLVAPTAEVTTQVQESISPGQDIRIQIDGVTKFEGETESGGTKRQTGLVELSAEHFAAELFESNADVTETGPPTDEDVLSAAITNANTTDSFTLNYVGTATTLNNDYDVSDRSVKRIFRDMMDRTDRIWWVDPATTTITVDDRGDRVVDRVDLRVVGQLRDRHGFDRTDRVRARHDVERFVVDVGGGVAWRQLPLDEFLRRGGRLVGRDCDSR